MELEHGEDANTTIRQRVEQFTGKLLLKLKPGQRPQSRADYARELFDLPGAIIVESAEAQTYGAFASPWGSEADHDVNDLAEAQ